MRCFFFRYENCPVMKMLGRRFSIQTRTFASAILNSSVRLAKRPVGLPTREDWQFVSEPLQPIPENGISVKVTTISLDPAMRGWMNDAKSYIRPVGIGEIMRASGIGKIVESRNPSFKVGDVVAGGRQNSQKPKTHAYDSN